MDVGRKERRGEKKEICKRISEIPSRPLLPRNININLLGDYSSCPLLTNQIIF